MWKRCHLVCSFENRKEQNHASATADRIKYIVSKELIQEKKHPQNNGFCCQHHRWYNHYCAAGSVPKYYYSFKINCLRLVLRWLNQCIICCISLLYLAMATKRDSIRRQIQQMKKIRDEIEADIQSYFISYFFSFAAFLEVILGIITCYLLDLYRCANRMQVPPFSVRGTL